MSPAVVVTAEHATNAVPADLRELFASPEARAALASHRGYDPGSLELARALARRFDAPLVAASATRLVVDLNRSEHHPRLFSEWTRPLPAERRTRLLDGLWRPHRARVEREVADAVAARGAVVHLAVHSFTPELDGAVRPMDAALLYDPARPAERAFAERWLAAQRARRPDLVLARNRPYRGVSDGLTTHLRRLHPDPAYLGLEVELNQRWPNGGRGGWRRLVEDLVEGLADALRGAR